MLPAPRWGASSSKGHRYADKYLQCETEEGVIHFVLGESVKSVEVRCELGPEGYGGLMGKTRKDQ